MTTYHLVATSCKVVHDQIFTFSSRERCIIILVLILLIRGRSLARLRTFQGTVGCIETPYDENQRDGCKKQCNRQRRHHRIVGCSSNVRSCHTYVLIPKLVKKVVVCQHGSVSVWVNCSLMVHETCAAHSFTPTISIL